MDNQILDAALEYASRGWSVIPISKEKKPLVKWENATREELTNPDNIREWWRRFPSANVAIVTGKRSGGLVVVDLDVDDDKGLDGVASLEAWCSKNYLFPIDSTATVQTGRGGRHLYFQSSFTFPNQVGCLDGVDIRGEGGCVVAPPSVHGKTRREYLWDIDTDEVEVPEADSDVIFFLTSMQTTKNGEYGQKNDFTEKTAEGGRNDKLFKYVSRLQRDGETDDDIREYAHAYNASHFNPPLDDDEVDHVIGSALKRYSKGSKQEQTESEPESEQKVKEFRSLKTVTDLMNRNIPDPTVLIGVGKDVPFLVEGTCILSAKPKLGKSWLALEMCVDIARGNIFLDYNTKKCSTLYLDLETSEALQQKRLRKVLKGEAPPPNFYMDSQTPTMANGFVDQIEHYMQEDPNIGFVVVDVFQIIRSTSKNSRETEYEHAYRDITPLNELADKYHISIMLVCHDRKIVDPDDPFSNILGSTGLQGAATQMIVMYKRRKEDPIHISVKGKTIDGLIDMDVKFEDGRWSVVEGANSAEREREALQQQYFDSNIRKAVIALVEKETVWKGRCTTLVNDAVKYDIGITESAKDVGGFLHRHQGRFLEEDGIKVAIINNGSGPKIYRFQKSTIDTIDENEELPLMDFEESSKYKASENPFL